METKERILSDASALLPDGEVVFQTAVDLESTTSAPVPVVGGSRWHG